MYEDFASTLAATMWADFDKTPAREGPTPEITGIETLVIDGNFPWTIVRVRADDGTVGIGECYPSPGVHEIITDYLRPVLIGETPLDVERLYNLMRASLSGRGSQEGVGTVAISGVEIALWDLAGKLLGQPVWQLLGGKMREEVMIYADCHAGEAMVESAEEGQEAKTYEPEAYAAAAQMAVNEGFDLVKFDLDVPSGRELNRKSRHFDLPEIEHKRQIVEAVTDEVGSNAEVGVDLHWNFNPETAERLCRALEPYDLALTNLTGITEQAAPEDLDFAMTDPQQRVDAVEDVEESIEVAQRLGCPFLTVHLGPEQEAAVRPNVRERRGGAQCRHSRRRGRRCERSYSSRSTRLSSTRGTSSNSPRRPTTSSTTSTVRRWVCCSMSITNRLQRETSSKICVRTSRTSITST